MRAAALGREPAAPADAAPSRGPFLLLTGQDYRSAKKANFHFIADELKPIGTTRFFSTGFSLLSDLGRDPRTGLRDRANRVERVNGVECYLWRTLLHPFNLRKTWLAPVAALGFETYRRAIPEVLVRWIRESRTILVESGLPALFYDAARRLNPAATMIYVASDDLATIGCAPFLVDTLARTAAGYDRVILPSRRLRGTFAGDVRAFHVPHGIDSAAFGSAGPSPFRTRLNAVSVGSMLFDPDVFTVASRAFPAVQFHVIGAGIGADRLNGPNLTVYGQMPFADTLPFLQHADCGVAAYEGSRVSAYLAETSMKLMQYGFLGLPAVCPQAAVGDARGRFGYDPADPASVRAAVEAALAHGRFEGIPALTWREVTERLLDPESFPDTAAEGVAPARQPRQAAPLHRERA